MIVGKNVRDDFGREAEASSSFLRYEIAFRYEPPAGAGGLLGGAGVGTGGTAAHHRGAGGPASEIPLTARPSSAIAWCTTNGTRGLGSYQRRLTRKPNRPPSWCIRTAAPTGAALPAPGGSRHPHHHRHGKHRGDADDTRRPPGDAELARPCSGPGGHTPARPLHPAARHRRQRRPHPGDPATSA